ncbi:MAG: hypothetical protein AAGN82_15685 [Myxococcota bacterium]
MSVALERWNAAGEQALDEIEAAHRALGGTGRGRRHATLQVNHAYTVLLSSQFQGFCRDLHTEAADFVVANTQPAVSAGVLRVLLTQGRKLDRGNPNPGNLGSDFARLGIQFWSAVRAVDAHADSRQQRLEDLNRWRNAIAHQDWINVGGDPNLRLARVRSWRVACNGLAQSFDRAVRDHLHVMAGHDPW